VDIMGIPKKNIIKSLLMSSFLLVPACLAAGFADAAAKKEKPAEEMLIEKPLRRLSVGEELTFNVAWLGINVGTCVASVKGIETAGGREAYVVELTAKTNDILSKIYPIDDRYTSYIDKEKFVTLKHAVHRREGRYKKDAVTIFDYKNNKAYFSNSLDGSKKVFNIPGYCQDSLSAAYYFRILDVKLGEKIEYKVVNNEQVYDIIGVIKNTARLKIRGKTYEAFYVEPYAKLKGQRVRKGRAGCWFSCDSGRLPVYGMVKAPLFTKVTAALLESRANASSTKGGGK
jgi:hypothetical protein